MSTSIQDDLPTKFAGQIENYDSNDYFDRKEARRLDPVTQYAMISSDEAIEDSGIDLDKVNKDRVAVIIGTGIGGMQTFYEQSVTLHESGARRVNPFFIPMLIPDMPAGQVSIKYGFRGPNFCAVSACATGSHNIGLAFDSIRYGQVRYGSLRWYRITCLENWCCWVFFHESPLKKK